MGDELRFPSVQGILFDEYPAKGYSRRYVLRTEFTSLVLSCLGMVVTTLLKRRETFKEAIQLSKWRKKKWQINF